MVRFVFAVAACFLAVQNVPAAEPVQKTEPPASVIGREPIEELLQSPADLDFGQGATVTAGDLLDMLHKQHHVSIRFDTPTLAAMYGVGTGAEKTVLTASKAPQTRLKPEALSADQALANQIREKLSGAQLHHYIIDVKVMQGTCWLSGSVEDGTDSLTAFKIASDTAGIKKVVNGLAISGAKTAAGKTTAKSTTVLAPFLDGPAPPEACHSADGLNCGAKQIETPQQFFKRAEAATVAIGTVDGRTISFATALRMALDAFPNVSADDSTGLPLAMSDASSLDYLVEDDCILITSRLKALTDKETRVYSIKDLKDVKAQDLSMVICQSIRPWSWRSRIDELGEQLKDGKLSIPPAALAWTAKYGVQLADETGIVANVGESTYTKNAESSKTDEKKTSASDDAQEAAMLGNALANGLVTFAQASLTTLEVVHYADPPTGSIRVLPGKLIITQSQAAHREIAKLLKQLGDE